MSDPEVIDLAFLRRQTAGDGTLERELLCLLDSQCAALLPLLSLRQDTLERREAAHSLRGAAAGLGANRLAAAAAAIEMGEEPPIRIERAVEEVSRAVERLVSLRAA
jgi:HPt (histidine-containing phosphotransfer) domain-containing protein